MAEMTYQQRSHQSTRMAVNQLHSGGRVLQDNRAAFKQSTQLKTEQSKEKEDDEKETLQKKSAPIQREEETAKPNNTGLPDNLKSGIENLSGMSMDNVKVHYNSAKPAQLNALAYAQGTDIHVASGQEQHLPHEAWHVVQQAQGRVKPTMQMKGGVPVNDDVGLEKEADVMGAKAMQLKKGNSIQATVNNESIDFTAFPALPNNIQTPSHTTVQRVFELDSKDAIVTEVAGNLINTSASAQAAFEAGQEKLLLEEKDSWKTLTRETLGIGVGRVDYNLMLNAETAALSEVEKKDITAKLAHEMVHLLHYQSSKIDFDIMGQRENWGLESDVAEMPAWDADPEEELTIKGRTKFKIEQWNTMAKIKYQEAKTVLTNEKSRLEGQRDANPAEGTTLQKKKHEQALTQILDLDKKLNEINANLDAPPAPQGAEIQGEYYILTNEHNENKVRKDLGLAERIQYANVAN
jgi:hypothetical protein